MMKASVGDISRTFTQFVAFSNVDMAPALSLKIKRIIKVVKKELATLGDVERETAAKFGGVLNTKDEMSFFMFPDAESQKGYTEAIDKARAVEVELPGDALTENELLEMKYVKPAILADLDWLIAV